MSDLAREKQIFFETKKDKKNFDSLYKYFVNDVYRFSYSILNNQHDAQDISSKVFIEFYKKFDSFEWKDISLKYWLFRTARNLCYKKFQIKDFDPIDEDLEIEDESEIHFVDQIMNLELVEEVKEIIKSLSPIEQELINLRIWEGMKFEDISTIQNSTTNTSIKRFHRSVSKIRKILDSREVKSFVTLPILFTLIKQVGTTHAYSAPVALTMKEFTSSMVIKSQLISRLTLIKAFSTSKLGITLVSLTLVMLTVTTGDVMYRRLSNNSDNTEIKESINLKPSPTPSITPSSNTALAPTKGLSISPTPKESNEFKSYYYPYLDISFNYPSDWTANLVDNDSFKSIIPCESTNLAFTTYLKNNSLCINEKYTPENFTISSPDNKTRIEFGLVVGLGGSGENAVDKSCNRIIQIQNKDYSVCSDSIITNILPGDISILKSYMLRIYTAENSDISILNQITSSITQGNIQPNLTDTENNPQPNLIGKIICVPNKEGEITTKICLHGIKDTTNKHYVVTNFAEFGSLIDSESSKDILFFVEFLNSQPDDSQAVNYDGYQIDGYIKILDVLN